MEYAAVEHPITGEPVRATVIEEIGDPVTHYLIEYRSGGIDTIEAEAFLDADYDTYMATYAPDESDIKTDKEKALDLDPDADDNRLLANTSVLGQ